LATIGSTFAVALSAGFLVQYGDAVAARWGDPEAIIVPEAVGSIEELTVTPVSAPVSNQSTLTAPAILAPIQAAVSLDEVPSTEITPYFDAKPKAAIEEENLLPDVVAIADCTPTLTAVEMKVAMVQLSLNAPCNQNEVLAIHHENMMFSAITDENGQLIVDVPALAEDAFFIAAFDGGLGAVAQTTVPEFSKFDRAVLLWQGDMGVELHALELGASYGNFGHISADSKGNFSSAETGVGGLLVELGNDEAPLPMMAEVYTFPSGADSYDGVVALSVEALVTDMNCGQLVEAQTIQLRPAVEPLVTSLSLTMPDCDAIGEYVLLNNVLEDLTLASK